MQYRNNKARLYSSLVARDSSLVRHTGHGARDTRHEKAGVTLVEMIIAVALIVIVFAAITPLFRGILNSWDSKAGAAETVQNGRVLIDHLNRNLSKAVKITAVSDSATTTGYIEYEDNDGNTCRYDIAASYVQFGYVGDLNDLAGPVSQLQFTCYDANDFDTPITDVNEIRTVEVQTTLTNAATLGADRTFTTTVYLRTNWETGSGSGSDPNLVGWWKLDETSGLTAADSSGNGNDGTLTNMAGDEWTTGVVGGALVFDGDNDYVDLPDGLHDFSGAFSVSLWAKWDDISGLQNLIGKDQDGSNFAFVLIKNAAGDLHLNIKLGGVQSNSSNHPATFSNGVWYHIVAVMESNDDVTLYVNAADPTTTAMTERNDLGDFRIGESPDPYWNSIKGTIDDVRVYNRALTAEEIALLAGVIFQEFTEAKAASDTTSITISTPSDTNEGNLLIAAVATDGDTSLSLAPPVGEDWTEIDVDDYGTEVTLGAWWKLADAEESATHEFDWTGDEQAYGWMMRFTGHDASDPINDSAPDGESSSTPTSPAVTTTVSDALILRLGGFDDGYITEDDPGLSDHTAITMDSSSSGGGCDLEDLSKGTPCEYDGVIGLTPALSQIDSTHYLCAYGGPDKDMGWAVVLTVDTGTWEITKGMAFQFESIKGKTPALAQIDSTHHLLAYSGDGDVGTAVILTVDTGTWEITKGTPLVYDDVKGKTPALAQIDSENYLCAYGGDGDVGAAVILTVDTEDTWEITKGTNMTFEAGKAKGLSLAQIDSTHYLCAYGELGTAVVLTVDTDAGTVTKETLSPLVFGIVKGRMPELAQINSTHYLCVYDEDGLGHALVLTVNTGTWEITQGTHLVYDSAEGLTPALAQIDSTNYLCAYDGGTGADGCAVVLTVDTGTWGITEGVSYIYDTTLGETPALAQIDDCDYLCAYEGEGSDGYAVVLKFASGGGDGVVSGGAGYVKQSAAGDSGTSDFALTASEESQMLTIAIAPDPNSGGGGGGEIRP